MRSNHISLSLPPFYFCHLEECNCIILPKIPPIIVFNGIYVFQSDGYIKTERYAVYLLFPYHQHSLLAYYSSRHIPKEHTLYNDKKLILSAT